MRNLVLKNEYQECKEVLSGGGTRGAVKERGRGIMVKLLMQA
jgi:hypothetical protein